MNPTGTGAGRGTGPLPITPGLMDLGRALAAWKDRQTELAVAARSYAAAVEAETVALVAYAAAVARGDLVDAGVVQEARVVLAAVLSARETAARAVGASRSPVVVRAARAVVDQAHRVAGSLVADPGVSR